jgi:hypothetical protein
MHPLLKDSLSSGNSLNTLNLVSEPVGSPYDLESDADLLAVVKSLGRHLGSLNTNLKEMKDLRIWIRRAEESLGEIMDRLEGVEGSSNIAEVV